jgi:hypothetical protein
MPCHWAWAVAFLLLVASWKTVEKSPGTRGAHGRGKHTMTMEARAFENYERMCARLLQPAGTLERWRLFADMYQPCESGYTAMANRAAFKSAVCQARRDQPKPRPVQ